MKQPRLLQNIATLGLLQVANFTLTLVTLPYVTRVLGVEAWGRVVFVQMMINYLVWFCNWGFYLGTTRKIAANRGNPTELADVYMATWFAQWVLTGAVIILLSGLFLYIPIFSKDRTLYIYGIGLIVGNVLMPFWFLNGMERIREVAAIQILTKMLSIPLIFLLLKDSNDAYLFIEINSGSALLMGIITVVWIKKTFLIPWSFPGMKRIYAELKEGTYLFVSTVWANLNGTLTPTALGIIAGPTELGYYNLADRARGAATTILHPITHALFPRMCHLFSTDQAAAARLLKRSGKIIITVSALISLILWLFAEQILAVLGGKAFNSSIDSLKWLSITPFLTTLSSFFIHQIIIPAQKNKIYYITIFATLCLSALAVVPIIYWKKSEGAAILTFVAELFLATVILISLLKKNFFLKRPSLELECKGKQSSDFLVE